MSGIKKFVDRQA